MSSGEVLAQILRDEGMPSRATLINWLREDPEAERQYLTARERLMEIWADDIIEIAEDGRNDWVERESARGKTFIALDREAVARSRLRIDARQWLLSKLRPEIYGDSQRIDLRGRIELSEQEVEAEIVALLVKQSAAQEAALADGTGERALIEMVDEDDAAE